MPDCQPRLFFFDSDPAPIHIDPDFTHRQLEVVYGEAITERRLVCKADSYPVHKRPEIRLGQLCRKFLSHDAKKCFPLARALPICQVFNDRLIH